MANPADTGGEAASLVYVTIDLVMAILAEVPVLQLLDIVIFVLDLIGLASLFEGRPKQLDTITIIKRLGRSRNPAGFVLSAALANLLDGLGVVLSDSRPQMQRLFGHARAQAYANLEAQGIDHARAKELIDSVLTQTTSADEPLPHELTQPLDPSLHMWADQAMLDRYQTAYDTAIADGRSVEVAQRLALRAMWRHARFREIVGVSVGAQPPPPPPPPPQGVQPEQPSCTDPCMQALVGTLQDFASAVSGSGSPMAALAGALPTLMGVIQALKVDEGMSALQALADCVCPKLADLAQAIRDGDNSIAQTAHDQLSHVAEAIDNLRKTEWETPGYFSQLANLGLVDPDVAKVTPQSAAGDHPMALKASDAAMARKVSSINPALLSMSPEEIVATGPTVKTTFHETWTDAIVDTLSAIIGALISGLTKGVDLVAPTVEEIAGRISAQVNPLLQRLLTGDFTAWEFLPRAILAQLETVITSKGEVTPDNVEEIGIAVLGFAFVVGQAIHVAAEIGGKLFYPVASVWGHNAAMAVQVLAYEEILGAFHAPLWGMAITEPARQRFAKKFRPRVPMLAAASLMYARGKIDRPTLDELVAREGLHRDYVDPTVAIAYRPISPMMLRQGFRNRMPPADLLSALVIDQGVDPQFRDNLEQILKDSSYMTLEQALETKALAAAGSGALTLDNLDQALAALDWDDHARSLARQIALYERQAEIAKQTEAAALAELSSGAISADAARSLMGAAGIDGWRIDLTVTLAAAKRAFAEARKLETKEQGMARSTYNETAKALALNYLDGVLTESALAVSLEVALEAYVGEVARFGASPEEAAALLDFGRAENAARILQLDAQKKGRLMYVFGLTLDRADAQALRVQVASIQEGVLRADIQPEAAFAQLRNLGIPEKIARAMVEKWIYQVNKKGALATG